MGFIILLGIVSFFGDFTYEGARSITGPYLAVLGATGTIVGIVSGLGELFGYGFRLVSGYLVDKTKRYWLFAVVGYFINLFAVPLLALTDSLWLASVLIIAERFGKALRKPPCDAMLSFAAHSVGRGWGFGIYQAMDQTGAVLGPLLVSVVLFFQGTYHEAFALLLISAVSAMISLYIAFRQYPHPEQLEISVPNLYPEGFHKRFWIYIIGVSCVAAGFIDFPLIAFHYQETHSIKPFWIPIIYSFASAVNGLAALVLGKLYDRYGINVTIVVTCVVSIFPLFVFSDSFSIIILGMLLWGLGMGAQESVVRAVVANFIQSDKRATAFGLLNIFYGTAWFLGSVLIGVLYDVSLPLVILFSIVAQLAAVPFFLWVKYAR